MGFQVLLAATPQSFTRHAADSEEKPTEAAGPGPASPHQLPCSWDALAVDSWCFDHSWHALESSLSMVTGWEAWPALGSWSLPLVSSHDEFLTIQHMVQAPQDRYVNRLRWLERSQNGETQLCSETGGVMLCSPVPRFPWAILGWSQGHEVLGWKQLHGVVHQLQAWWEGYGSGPNIPGKDSLSWSFWGRSAAWGSNPPLERTLWTDVAYCNFNPLAKAWYSYDGASFLSLVFATTKPYATEYVDIEKEKPHIISYYTVLPLPDKQCWWIMLGLISTNVHVASRAHNDHIQCCPCLHLQ